MTAIHIRATSAEQWAGFLAEPEKHWQTGYSARTLAYSWQEADGFPSEVRSVLGASKLASIELLLGIPEHQVPLPGGSRPSQSDIWVLAKNNDGLISIAVEGKVEEPFGPMLDEWLADPSPGKSARLSFLQDQLGLAARPAGSIRYQLLHRTVSALVEAKRFCARQAVMLVHSFSPTHRWFEDYALFAEVMGTKASLNQVAFAGNRGGVDLHLCWVSGDPAYLAR